MKNQVKGACVICDDISDNPSFARHSAGIMSLAVRARHVFILAAFYSVQKLRTVQSAVRVNIRNMWIWRARNALEFKNIYEEVGANVTEEEFKRIYEIATEGHSFLNIRLDQPPENQFFKGFESRLRLLNTQERRRGGENEDAHAGTRSPEAPESRSYSK